MCEWESKGKVRSSIGIMRILRSSLLDDMCMYVGGAVDRSDTGFIYSLARNFPVFQGTFSHVPHVQATLLANLCNTLQVSILSLTDKLPRRSTSTSTFTTTRRGFLFNIKTEMTFVEF